MNLRANEGSRCEVGVSRPTADTLLVELSGQWELSSKIPPVSIVLREIASETVTRRVRFDAEGIEKWDSGLLIFLMKIVDVPRRGLASLPTFGGQARAGGGPIAPPTACTG